MRYIKKIDSIPLVDGGNVIDSLETTDNQHKNAPSIAAVKELVNEAIGEVIGDLSDIFDRIYPIGSIYYTTNNNNPSVLFGGTWEPYAMGRVIVGYYPSDLDFNVVGKVGGDKYINYTPYGYVEDHALTVNELPNHTHWERIEPRSITCGAGSDGGFFTEGKAVATEYYTGGVRVSSGTLGNGHKHKFTGSPVRWENFPSYQVVKIWRRIA